MLGWAFGDCGVGGVDVGVDVVDVAVMYRFVFVVPP